MTVFGSLVFQKDILFVSALEAVREYFEMLPRESAAKLAYMITWSTSGYPLLARAEAQFVAQDGIQLMIIGVGDGVSQDELNSLQVFLFL